MWDVVGSTFSISEVDEVEPNYGSLSAMIIANACVVTDDGPIIDMIDQMNLCRDRALEGGRWEWGILDFHPVYLGIWI